MKVEIQLQSLGFWEKFNRDKRALSLRESGKEVAWTKFKELAKGDNGDKVQEIFSKLSDFTPTQKFIKKGWYGLQSVLAIDEVNKKVCMIYPMRNDIYNAYIYTYQDIIGVEMIQNDGAIAQSTERGSQIGGTVVGGLLLGGVGAIIGGLSGKKESNVEAKKLALRIVVNDIQDPFHMIEFFSCSNPIKRSDLFGKKHFEEIEHWLYVLQIIIASKQKNS